MEKTLPGQIADKTYDSYADTVRLHLRPALGRIVLRRLVRFAQVDEFLAWKRDQQAIARTRFASSVRCCVGRLRQAEREGLVPRNVAALLDRTEDSKRRRSGTVGGPGAQRCSTRFEGH